jgi:uncharacterized membrane protein
VHGSRLTDRISYDLQTQELRIHFLATDTIWVYYGVPEAMVLALLGAESLGAYFNQAIRDHYPAQRLDGTEGPTS